MWGDIGGVVLEGVYGEVACQKRTTEAGGRNLGGWGTSYIFGFLPLGVEDSEMPGEMLSVSIA